MARKIIGGICLLFALGGLLGIATQSGESVESNIVLTVIFLTVGLILLLKKGKTKEQKVQQKAEKQAAIERHNRSLTGEHVAGLPIAQGASCLLKFEDNYIGINGGGNDFRVAFNKITNIQVKTSTEIHKQYVSSIGGAVGGAVLFGPLGAIVGGRAKEKTSKVIEYYFIITYNKNDAIDYLSFQIQDNIKAGNIVSRFSPLLTGKSAVVDL